MSRTTAARLGGALFALVFLSLSMMGCGAVESESGSSSSQPDSSSVSSSLSESSSEAPSSAQPERTVSIELLGDTGKADGDGVTIDRNRIVITKGGDYRISGALFDGQLIVETDGKETVRLLLNGVNLYCSDSAPLLVRSTGETIVTLADNSANVLADAKATRRAEDWGVPQAAVYCRGALTIQGNGTLQVDAPYQNGVQSEGALQIAGGVLKIQAERVGLRGGDALQVRNAILTVQAGDDGLQADGGEGGDQGAVLIESGNLTLTTGGDGIQAGGQLRFNNGSCTIQAGGGCAFTARYTDDWTDEGSAKGLKAGTDLLVAGGRFDIDAADDALYAKGTMQLSGGALQLRSAADGVHAAVSLQIHSGTVTVLQALQGLTSATITLRGGTVHIAARDCGVRAAGQSDPAPDDAPADSPLRIEGGLLVVDAEGEGLDADGGVHMTGGTVLVGRSARNENDKPDDAFLVDGGTLIVAGGGTRAVSAQSGQYVLALTLPEQPAGTLVHLETAEGKSLLTYAPSRAYGSVLLSLPTLEPDVSYLLYVGGAANGMVSDGVYTGGSYTGGARAAAFQITGPVTELTAPDEP